MPENKDQDCIFCKIAAQEIQTPLEYEDEKVVAFNDINSQAPVHFLVIPKKHIPRIGDLSEEDQGLMDHLFKTACQVAKQKGIYEDGYRLVINSGDNGGQTVYHLHLHVMGGRFMRWPPG